MPLPFSFLSNKAFLSRTEYDTILAECDTVKLRLGQILVTLTFLALLLGSAMHTRPLLAITFLCIGLFLLPLVFQLYKEASVFTFDIQDVLYPALGAIVTFILHKETALTPVTASALIGMVGYFIKKDHAAGIFAGSFAGMMGLAFLYHEAIIVSIFIGVVYAVSTNAYAGFGGRLGTMGLTATLLGGLIFGHVSFFGSPLGKEHVVGVILFGLIGGGVTYVIQHRFKQNAVIASSVVGLALGLALPGLLPAGAIYAVVAFQNSFIGMASKERLSNLLEALLASLLGSMLFIFLYPYFGELGGKLGTTAMISVLIIYQLKHKRFSFR